MTFLKFDTASVDNNYIMRLFFGLCSAIIIMASFDTLATSTGDPVGDSLCNVIKLFQSGTAKGIAIVGVIALGIQTIRGKLEWTTALVVIAAIIILFKASDIVNMVSPGGADNCVS